MGVIKGDTWSLGLGSGGVRSPGTQHHRHAKSCEFPVVPVGIQKIQSRYYS